MSRADYAHWNEEQDRVWWEEEGKHEVQNEPPDPDEYDREGEIEAEIFEDECYQLSDEELAKLCEELREKHGTRHWRYDIASNERYRREQEAR